MHNLRGCEEKDCQVCLVLDLIDMGAMDDALEDILLSAHQRKRNMRHARQVHGPHTASSVSRSSRGRGAG